MWILVLALALPVGHFLLTAILAYGGIRAVQHRVMSFAAVSEGEVPPGVVFVVAATRKQLEQLGFVAVGWRRITPNDARSAPYHSLVLHNPQAFSSCSVKPAEPLHQPLSTRVCFWTKLQNGWELITADGIDGKLPFPVPRTKMHDSRALELESMYRDHLRFVAAEGIEADRSPVLLESYVARQNEEALTLRQSELDSGWLEQEPGGNLRVNRWRLLAFIPGFYWSSMGGARLAQRRAKGWPC